MGEFAEKYIDQHVKLLETAVTEAQKIHGNEYFSICKDKFYYIGPNNEVLLFTHFVAPSGLQVTILTYREFIEKVFPQFNDPKSFFHKLDNPPVHSLEKLAQEEKISFDNFQKLLSEARKSEEKIAEIRF